MNPELTSIAPDGLHSDPLSTVVEQTAARAGDDAGHWIRTAFQARQDGLVTEARALLEAAAARFPTEAHVLHDLARLDEAARNWPAAERNWQAYSAMSPTAWWGFAELARALREQGRLEEADAVLADAWVRFPQEAAVGFNYARMAEFRGAWTEAVARWAVVRERFPQHWEGPAGQARGLRVLGQPDQARTILLEAIARFPAQTVALNDLARLEEAERNWSKAEDCWRSYIALDATHWRAHLGLANALHEQSRTEEAEARFADAQERFPEEAGVFIDHARMAESRGDWPTAGARWKLVAELFPDAWEGLAGQARSQREQGRLDVARGFLVHAVDQFPAATGPLHDLARLEEAEGNWPASERCWRAYVTVDPTHWWAHLGLAKALSEQGEDSAAETVLAAQSGRFGHEPAVLIEYARMADQRGDWEASQVRWEDVAERFPHRWDGIGGVVRSLRAQGRLEEAAALLVPASDRFEDQDGPLLERAHLAEAQGDWSGAADAWRSLAGAGQRSWWFYSRLLQAECRHGNIAAAVEAFADARARFPDARSTLTEFIGILIDEGYREQARDYLADALNGEPAPIAEELVQIGQLALRCADIDRAREVVKRLRAYSLEDAEVAAGLRTLETRIADIAAENLARVAPSGDPGHKAQLQPASIQEERRPALPGAQGAVGGGSWLRRAAGLINPKSRGSAGTSG